MKSTLTTFFAAAGLLLSGTLAQAVIVDLTTDGSSGTINGARYEQIDPQSTGTGVIDSFAQIGNNDPTAHAYNTTDNNTLDNGSPDNFNHSITLADVPIVTISGNPYRQFMLDINENNNAALDQFLSLDEVQIFVGGTANSNVDTFTAGILDHDGTLIYRMDAGGDSTVGLNYALNTGSGSGDMFLYVPSGLFGGNNGAVVTLYSHFGGAGSNPAGLPAGNYNNSDGFEEWAVLEPGPVVDPREVVPEGGTSVVLLGLAIAGLGIVRKSLRKA